jgi:hypothetical protein
MLDSLSRDQRAAFESLNLGPLWLNKESHEAVKSADFSGSIALCIIFQNEIEPLSVAQNVLLGQIFHAAKLPLEQAQIVRIGALKTGTNIETALTFDAVEQVDFLLEKQSIKIATRINLPRLAAIAADGKSKAMAWKAVKAFLLSKA